MYREDEGNWFLCFSNRFTFRSVRFAFAFQIPPCDFKLFFFYFFFFQVIFEQNLERVIWFSPLSNGLVLSVPGRPFATWNWLRSLWSLRPNEILEPENPNPRIFIWNALLAAIIDHVSHLFPSCSQPLTALFTIRRLLLSNSHDHQRCKHMANEARPLKIILCVCFNLSGRNSVDFHWSDSTSLITLRPGYLLLLKHFLVFRAVANSS